MNRHASNPLHAELGLAEGMRVGLDDPPAEFVGLTLLPIPSGITLHSRIAGNMDMVIGFYERRRDLEDRLPVLRRRIPDDGAIWVAWPQRATRTPAGLNEDVVREVAAGTDLTATRVCRLDDVWTAVRLDLSGDPAAG